MTEKAGPDKGPGVGGLLRASRLRIGEDLRDVAAALYIRYSYLNAIEEGRYEALPGPTYAVGFVRVYAEHLGLDAGEVVRRFKAESAALSEKRELVFPSPLPESGVPSGAILFIGVLIAGLAYGVWYISSTHDKSIAGLIPALPERFMTLLDRGSGGDGEPASATTAAPKASEPTVTAAPTATTSTAVVSPEPTGDAGAADVTSADIAPTDIAPTDVASVTPLETPSVPETQPADSRPAVIPAESGASTILEQPAAEPVPPPVAASAPETPAAPAPEQTTAAAREPTLDRAIPGGTAEAATAPEGVSFPTPVENATTTMAALLDAATASAEKVEPPLPPSPPTQEVSGLTRDGGEAGNVNTSAPAGNTDGASASDGSAAQTAAATVPSAGTASVEAAPSANPPQDSGGRIVVRAKSASWIQVRDEVAKQLLMTRLMQPGDTYRVPDRPGLKLLTGNAGALEILVDGETVPAIGPVGAVRRDVALDIERLKNGSAAEN